MGTILALGVAAAVYPQLLAVVVIILTRPNPKPLLWACYLGAVALNAACATVVLVLFRHRESVLGTSSHRLGATTYFVFGGIALVIAVLAASGRSREVLAGRLPLARRRRGDKSAAGTRDAPGYVERVKARTDEALRAGSLPVAVFVGGVLGLPGPFDLVAVGHLARGDYGLIAVIGLLAAFLLLKFALIELPIASYAVTPERTGAWVERFSAWMRANHVAIIAGVVALVSLFLIYRGFTRLG